MSYFRAVEEAYEHETEGLGSILKGLNHSKMKILSFTHPEVVPNLYEFLSAVEHKKRYFEECW